MVNSLKKLHSQLIGLPDSTTLQARIFHEVSLIAMFAVSVGIIANFIIGVPYVNINLSITLLVICGAYYNSRYFGRLKLSVIIFTVSSGLMLLVNYFINSGIKGPTLLLCLVSMVFTLSVMPSRQYFFWVLFNACIVSVLMGIEYFYPQTVKDTYISRTGYFVDILTTYLGVIACIGVVLTYLIKGHHAEKAKAMNASIALKVANDSKTRLLSILSHDLRSPLNSIQSFLEVLVDYDLAENEKTEIKQALLKETKNTQVMLFNLLSWTKAQMEGGVKVNLTGLNLNEVIVACLNLQQSTAMEKMITIENNVDRDMSIIADLDMLKLVVRNLLNNAIKFTRSGGEIIIKSEIKGAQGILTIQDNGIGIPPEQQKELFSVESNSTYGTNNEKGVGLGLLLCKEFTELQGGTISLISSTEAGTSFSLTFPLHAIKVSSLY
ncbi:HAMP domain-containing sensor histidine kinase [Pedobacter psychroterrae]|uniref:histidine kinase n=1 Tax=Pedobacter psychroterrae TaxID=2530453 RepID=A0A4R0NCV4_9SPHI|nr:HAMP domain-containing sensor histidine kinase [Pedobacter psychroterrae]TCC98085.1 HAMP domain-containing histidine kinase [Pedobacter psychroterrae]